ncbi:hypothetical protein EL22_16335 [Halostagnicola sp. A56]|nr:hypothetical protein EL22_16335 [Halostagnicola sp. A56]
MEDSRSVVTSCSRTVVTSCDRSNRRGGTDRTVASYPTRERLDSLSNAERWITGRENSHARSKSQR